VNIALPISPIIFFAGMLVAGIIGLAIGRRMNTHAEEEWKGEFGGGK